MKAAFSRAGHLARRLALILPLLLATPALADETLTYDANGNVETRTLPGGTTTYGYDDLNRVSSEAGPAKTQSLSYDPNDNRLTDGSGTKTYSPNSDQLLTDNGQNISLDAAGNTIQARGLNFTWNQAGQLKTVSQGTTLLATYYYDDRGRRTRKVREGGGSLSYRTTIYVHDLYDRLTSELNGAGNPQRTYVWRDDIPVAIIDHPGDTVLYLETDHLNTPIAARNQAGTVVWKWESDAFGSTPANEDPDGDGIGTTINLRFPGQYYDKESGLHCNHHRYYDPKIGRYLSSDPIGIAAGPNTYGYVGGNPLKYTDPTGEIVPALVYGAVATVGLVSGAIIANGVPQAGPKGSDDLLGGATGASSSGGTGTGTQSGSSTEQCPPVDECAVQLEECLKSETQSKRGSVYGSSRCLWCSEACKRNGGTWPKTVPTSAGGYLSCKIK